MFARARRLGGAAVLDGDDHDTFTGLEVETEVKKPLAGRADRDGGDI